MTCPDPQQQKIEQLEAELREANSRLTFMRARYLAVLDDFQTWREAAIKYQTRLKEISEAASRAD